MSSTCTTSYRDDENYSDPQRNTRIHQIQQKLYEDYPLDGGATYCQGTPPTSEASWPQDDNETPQYRHKRARSPSPVRFYNNKRLHEYKSPAKPRASGANRLGLLDDSPQQIEEEYSRRQPRIQDDLDLAGNPKYSSFTQSRSDAGYHYPSIYRPSSYIESSDLFTTLGSSRNSRSQTPNIIRSPEQGIVPGTKKSPRESFLRYQEEREDTQSRKKASRQVQPQSPNRQVRGNEAQRGQHRQYAFEKDQRQLPNRRRNVNAPSQKSQCPFDDGRVPGEGGSSSDEDILLAPVVCERSVYKGGARYHERASTDKNNNLKSGGPRIFKQVSHESYWNGLDRSHRHQRKKDSRTLNILWERALKTGDNQELARIEAEAEKANLKLILYHSRTRFSYPSHQHRRDEVIHASCHDRNQLTQSSSHDHTDQPEYESAYSLSPCPSLRVGQLPLESAGTPRKTEPLRNSSHSWALAPYHDQNDRGRSESQSILRATLKGHRSQSRSLRVRTSVAAEDGQNKNRVPLPAFKFPRQVQENVPEIWDIDDDAGPIEKHLQSKQHKNQQTTRGETASQITKILSRESISCKKLSKPTHMYCGSRVFRGIAETRGAVHLTHNATTTSNSRSQKSNGRIDDSKISESGSQTEEKSIVQKILESPIVIDLLSSPESTPVTKRSTPMKDRLHFSKKKPTIKPTGTRSLASQNKKESIMQKENPEAVRQQICADRIIAAELKAAEEDLEARIFGEVIGLTIEEQEHQAAIKRAESHRIRDAKIKEQFAIEEEGRFAEMQKQKEIDEARKMSKLQKEREEKSKKAKREIERKRQLMLDGAIREEKRRATVERIKAQRAKELLEAEERAKREDKNRNTEMEQLKIQLMKKDLEVKRLQVASLVGVKADSSVGTSKNSANETAPPPNLPNGPEGSLFISNIASSNGTDLANPGSLRDVDKRAGFQGNGTGAPSMTGVCTKAASFRKSMADEREAWPDKRRVTEDKKRSKVLRVRLESRRKKSHPSTSPNLTEFMNKKPKRPKEPKKPKKPHLATKKKANLEEQPNKVPTLSQPLIVRNPIEAEPVQPKRTKWTSRRPSLVPPPSLSSSPKAYSSGSKFVSEAEREKLENEKRARLEATKQKRNSDRRKKNSDRIAAKKRQKLLDEAKQGGHIVSDAELKISVDAYMKIREEKYQKQQAKKAAVQGIPDTNGTLQGEPQRFAQQQSLSQPQESVPLSTETTEDQQEQDSDVGTRAQKATKNLMDENSAAVKRKRKIPYGTAAAFRTVRDFRALVEVSDDSDESEDDPNDEEMLNLLRAARTARTARTEYGDNKGCDAEQKSADKGKLDLETFSKQLKDGFNKASNEISGSNNWQQSVSPNAVVISSNSKGADIQFQKSYSRANRKINIYNVEKTEIIDMVTGSVQRVQSFTVRDEANNLGEDMIDQYRKQATTRLRYFTSGYKDGLYSGTIRFNEQSSVTVSVTSIAKYASELPSLCRLKKQKSYGDKVWVVKRSLKKVVVDPEMNSVTTTSVTEDAAKLAYPTREEANHEAAQNFITYIKPEGARIDFLLEWTRWQQIIREKLEEVVKAGTCFDCGVEKVDGDLQWLQYDDVDYKIEEKESADCHKELP